MNIVGKTKCNKCGKIISIVKKIDTIVGYKYEKENLSCRFIDKWGFERNFCKDCVR